MDSRKYAEALRLAFCASGICICYWVYGFLQENIFTNSGLGATFILVLQSFANIIVALIWRQFEGKDQKESLPHFLLLVTSSTYVAAMACSNEALQFVSYPTAVLAKSCKMIPTMIMGHLVEKRNYTWKQWFSAVCISMGIGVFHLSRIRASNETASEAANVIIEDHYWKGMLLLLISLCMDGFLGSLQGMIKRSNRTGKRRAPTAVETMLFINLYSLIYLFPMALFSGQWEQGVELLLQKDTQLLISVVNLNAVVSMGQIFVFLTITWYSSLVCATITTARKFVTILYSVWHFGHHFSMGQWISICLVFGGLYLSIADGSASIKTQPFPDSSPASSSGTNKLKKQT